MLPADFRVPPYETYSPQGTTGSGRSLSSVRRSASPMINSNAERSLPRPSGLQDYAVATCGLPVPRGKDPRQNKCLSHRRKNPYLRNVVVVAHAAPVGAYLCSIALTPIHLRLAKRRSSILTEIFESCVRARSCVARSPESRSRLRN